ncbi:DNA-directed RNA polymeras-like protein I subunit [Calycina marina]|uniref:DNA-directed RNA polymerase subunit n=1 Tax=Calycina marina TaxID=1763456 RepID=A0A9P7Z905_9HELO|nr:DNA-directed RNA polymeras-like protein I subunit [Calycina marina]
MNISQPVPSVIACVDFGFYTPEEIKAVSVKQIQNHVTFDTLLNPIPGGLYDPALGAWGENSCTTCNLSSFACPGHAGHIELPVPVYHPTFMSIALRLLRAKCAYCDNLKLSRREVNRFHCKLRLIQHGLLSQAEHVDTMDVVPKHAEKEAGSESSDEDTPADNAARLRNDYVKREIKVAAKENSAWNWNREKNEGVSTARQAVIKDFMKSISVGKACHNCQGISPGYRKDKYTKIFEKALTGKDKAKMAQGDYTAVNSVVKIQQVEKNGGDFDEGVADMYSSSNEEDEDAEGTGQDLDVDGDVVIGGSTKTAKASKADKVEASQRFVNATEVKASLDALFEQEQEIFSLIYSSRSTVKRPTKVTADMFFLQTLLVPPNKYRPEARTGAGDMNEDMQNNLYKLILKRSESIITVYQEISKHDDDESSTRRRRDYQDLQEDWCALQDAVNSLIDRDRNPIQGAAGKKNEDGIKQKLEKKEGLFRKNMMGKRVNFAARSVISPDPNIETNEIGVPPVFAKKLTYPEPVTSHNFKELQQAVINGVDVWPGAAAIENENGMVISLRTKTPDERMALANQLLATSGGGSSGGRNKKVHRHLTNGDVVLMNRQPTLHKPSIMGHRARVLPGEKTIRMHYANCNTYNADFDGDEMNMHFPQNEVARAEALQIADTDHQYLVATSGKPLRGLIQDHISVSVWLCNRDTFFDRATYQQLLYNCLRPESGHIVGERIETVPPAIIKPVKRWTGKQVITTILKNIMPLGHGPLCLASKTSTPADRWAPNSEEGTVQFEKGEFVTGILDKSQIGPSGGGFVHSIHEAYGPAIAGKLLSALGRLLTKYLHMRAFTCGMDDLRLTPQGEVLRKEKLGAANALGVTVAAKYVGLKDEKPSDTNKELLDRLEGVLRDDGKQTGLDIMMNAASGNLSSSITLACLPGGLVKQFPKNQMQNMTTSGAKGTAVNANLISCNLGQQVLEGRRVPVMVSGKSLPCFKPYETHLRAGGYITNRFLTGIRPQEYYFHAMAGREGLIDTAVKTSRSGYLQRCLIKGMEGLKVEYDTSVRDSDGSMIQFLYGEDGLDVTKQKHLRNFKFILENLDSQIQQLKIYDNTAVIFDDKETIVKQMKRATKYAKNNSIQFNAGPDPVQTQYNPGRHAYATSESYYNNIMEYLGTNPDKLIKTKTYKEGLHSRKQLEMLLAAKYSRSTVDPGEAVGIVAGQSVGEPSTQMTLNTFHLAGHSAKNVTLGIPRLREIVMTASANISTPSMTLRLNEELSAEDGERFAKSISELFLAEVVDQAFVKERMDKGIAHAQAKIYDIEIKLFPSADYTETYAISKADVLKAFQNKFAYRLQKETRKVLKRSKDSKSKKVVDIGEASRALKEVRPDAVRERDEDDDDDHDDDDATNDKLRSNRAEAVSYGANDEEDNEIQANAQKDAMEPEDSENIDEGIGLSPPPTPNDEDSDEEEKDTKKDLAANREADVMTKNEDVTSFKWDDKDGEWCRLSLEYEANIPKVLMLSIVEKVLREVEIQKISDLGACTFVAKEDVKEFLTGKNIKAPVVHTAGVNLQAMHVYGSYINPNKISTNDIAAMLRIYGVEACRATIIQELSGVFGGYGIDVDQRHLNLIADFMTRGGGFVGFSRNGLKSSVSPFMKMSFETTVGFLADAVCDGDFDDLTSPSSRIVIGRMSKVGTGAFDVLTQVPVGEVESSVELDEEEDDE